MNVQTVFQELETASDFELYRLNIAINKLLEDPERINTLRKKLVIGMQVEYFKSEVNKVVVCEILEIKRTRVTVKEIETEERWLLPFYCLNLDGIATTLVANNQRGLSKAELHIGSTVGFVNSQNKQDYFGQVVKLNPKRAIILVGDEKWKVPYQMLFSIVNSELDDNSTLLLAD